MSQRDWKAIWSSKELGPADRSILARLIAIDGFSSVFGRMDDAGQWLDYVLFQAKRLGVVPGDSLYEVGCGGGAFLYPFWERGHRVAGADQAPNLITIARQAMPGAALQTLEARDIPAQEQADVVVSNGVFLYFPDQAYAEAVLRKMIAMARKSVGIFDVCDLATKAEAIAARRGVMGDAEYEAHYHGLDHLYFDRQWFARVLSGLPARVDVVDQSLAGYGNNAYRFNVYIHLDG